jgi:hypothetical protein
MKASQIPFYAACPILYWPWLWLQFWRLDRWMADRVSTGARGEVMLHLGPRGTLTITFMSDNLRDDLPDTYTTLTFESLTWGDLPDYVWLNQLIVRKANPLLSAAVQTRMNAAEISEALIPIP